MEIPSASECPAVDGSSNVGESVRNGIGLDGERNHPQIHRGESRRRPFQACRFSVPSLATLTLLMIVKIPS